MKKRKMLNAWNLPMLQQNNDAPIMACTQVDEFSRPMEPTESARSMQHINSFQSKLTAPICQQNGTIDERDTCRSCVESAGDLATPLRVSVHNLRRYVQNWSIELVSLLFFMYVLLIGRRRRRVFCVTYSIQFVGCTFSVNC